MKHAKHAEDTKIEEFNMEHILEVKQLNTFFRISQGIVRAVEGVSFNLKYSESLGLVGESGCGKTTTALSVMGMLPDNGFIHQGEILFEGRNLLETGRGPSGTRVLWGKRTACDQGFRSGRQAGRGGDQSRPETG